MRRRSHALLMAAFCVPSSLLLLSILGGTSAAYVRTRSHDDQHDLIWPDPQVTLTLHPGMGEVVSADAFVTAAAGATAAWSSPQVATSLELTLTTDSTPRSTVGFDHESSIIFQTEDWSSATYPADAVALTTVWDRDGQIIEADIELNAVDPRFHWAALSEDPSVAALSTDIDLQNALTHELGHVLGLAHPCDLASGAREKVDNLGQAIPRCTASNLPAGIAAATMFPSTKTGNVAQRTLSPDEVTALADLYPLGRSPLGAETSDGAGCSVAGESSHVMFPVLGVAALLAARRRRRTALLSPSPPDRIQEYCGRASLFRR